MSGHISTSLSWKPRGNAEIAEKRPRGDVPWRNNATQPNHVVSNQRNCSILNKKIRTRAFYPKSVSSRISFFGLFLLEHDVLQQFLWYIRSRSHAQPRILVRPQRLPKGHVRASNAGPATLATHCDPTFLLRFL